MAYIDLDEPRQQHALGSGLAGDSGPAGDHADAHTTAWPPVFLHCGWRTRGTWIWNRFRGLDGVTAYYEPLAEQLATLRPATLARINALNWASGHPGVDRPYFDEFRPFLNPRQPGVLGYQRGFATEDFFSGPDAELPELEAWLRQLVRAARAGGRQPVLKFCRSLGRAGWMRRRFPDAVHVAVLRDPFTQFTSSLTQYGQHGTAYFLAMPLLLLARARRQPEIAACLDHLGARLPEPEREAIDIGACEAYLRRGDPALWYRGFLAFWVLTAARATAAADLIIDSDALARDAAYRRRSEIALGRLTGRMARFDDVSAGPEGRVRMALLRASDVLDAHAGAEAFLAGLFGARWADMVGPGADGPGAEPCGGPGYLARKLAEARSRALGADITSPEPVLDAGGVLGFEPDTRTTMLDAMARAARAERELAAMRASRCWRITAPLRWVSEAMVQSIGRTG